MGIRSEVDRDAAPCRLASAPFIATPILLLAHPLAGLGMGAAVPGLVLLLSGCPGPLC